MELFRQLDYRQTNGLTELFLKSLSRLKNILKILEKYFETFKKIFGKFIEKIF